MQLPNEAPATVFEAFARAAACHGEKPFLAVLPETAQAYGIAAGEISYSAALAQIKVLSDAYRAQGLRRRPSGRHFDGKPPGIFPALVCAQCARRIAGAHQSGHACRRTGISDRPFRDRGGGRDPAARCRLSPRRRKRSDATSRSSDRTIERRIRDRRRRAARPIATANAPCSTPPAPQAGQKAACCRTNIFSTPAIGTRRSAA